VPFTSEPMPAVQAALPPYCAPSPRIPNPLRLSLDLRIHAFIETFRTRPLRLPLVLTQTPLALSQQTRNPDTNTTSTSSRHNRLFHDIESLLVSVLDDPARTKYRREMLSVAALLAYNEPESAPTSIRRYLSTERREELASRVNRAVLCKSPPSFAFR
jgi:hypothetical protein